MPDRFAKECAAVATRAMRESSIELVESFDAEPASDEASFVNREELAGDGGFAAMSHGSSTTSVKRAYKDRSLPK